VGLAGGPDHHDMIRAIPGGHAHPAKIIFKAT
jgi:hypothetical protein